MCLIYQLPRPGTESFMQQQQGVLTLMYIITKFSNFIVQLYFNYNLGENIWQNVGKSFKVGQDQKTLMSKFG